MYFAKLVEMAGDGIRASELPVVRQYLASSY
jgi:hypothetical protein